MNHQQDRDLQVWLVTLDGTQQSHDVVVELKKIGFLQLTVMDAIGVITGRADQSIVEAARILPGVSDVEPETPVSV